MRTTQTTGFLLTVIALGVGSGEVRSAEVRGADAQAASADSQWQDAIRNLRHPEAKVRIEALEQLGSAGYSAAAEYVAPLVTDPDDRVQAAAIDAELTFFLIEPVGSRRVLSLTGGSKSRAQQAFDAGVLVRASTPAPLILMDSLTTAMRDDNARIRFDAVHALGVIGESPVPPAQAAALADGMDHYDATIRAATARVLGRLRVREAGDRLIAGLNDSSAIVRRFSAEALGLIREERAVQSLMELTDHYGRDAMAADTLLALARIAHGASRELLRSRLSDRDPAIRLAAAEGLGRLRDAESLETLKARMTGEPNQQARLAAIFAVGQLGEPQAHLLAGALASPELNAQARDYLLEMGAPAIPGVRAALDVAADARFRADLIHLLGFIGTRETVAVVEPFQQDNSEDVKRAAANAIARLQRSIG